MAVYRYIGIMRQAGMGPSEYDSGGVECLYLQVNKVFVHSVGVIYSFLIEYPRRFIVIICMRVRLYSTPTEWENELNRRGYRHDAPMERRDGYSLERGIQ